MLGAVAEEREPQVYKRVVLSYVFQAYWSARFQKLASSVVRGWKGAFFQPPCTEGVHDAILR